MFRKKLQIYLFSKLFSENHQRGRREWEITSSLSVLDDEQKSNEESDFESWWRTRISIKSIDLREKRFLLLLLLSMRLSLNQGKFSVPFNDKWRHLFSFCYWQFNSKWYSESMGNIIWMWYHILFSFTLMQQKKRQTVKINLLIIRISGW